MFDLILTEYDEQAHIKKEKDWSRQEGLVEGISEGISVGKQQLTELYRLLIQEGRMDDLKKATEDSDFQDKLLKEYQL